MQLLDSLRSQTKMSGARARGGVFFALIFGLACLAASDAPRADQAGKPAPPPSAAASSSSAPPPSAPVASDQAAQPEKKQTQGYRLPPEKYRQAVAYARARDWLYFIRVAWGFLVLALILRWRLGARFRDWAERAGRSRLVQAIVFAPLLLLTLDALELPAGMYSHWLARKYEQSIEPWGAWFQDWAKSEGLGILLGTFLIWMLYGLIRRSPRRWWFYSWLASLPIIVFLLFISPVLIDPLFFRYEPLAARQPQLAAQIETVVQRAGMHIPPDHLFEMKASQKLKTLNAYVTGIGASKRVVVWDTTIARMTRPQILFVFGHEMGHYVLGHVPRGIAAFAMVLLVFLYAGFRLLRWMLARWRERWAIRAVDDWASLPALLLLLSVFSFLATPVGNAFSRYLEHQADVYGLEVIHGVVPDAPEVSAQAFQILGEVDLEEPDPPAFIKFWLYSHPPLNERILLARTYNPWANGQPPKFVQ